MTALDPQNGALDKASFQIIADIAYRASGLTLVEQKSSMIQSRLRHRLRDLDLTSFEAYCDFVQSDEGYPERQHLISALTTNVSHFFREKQHFDMLRDEFAASRLSACSGQEIRIWSAGCSNGQEAYSIAMTVLESVAEAGVTNLRILATDIDPEVVRFARKATFPDRLMNGVSDGLRQKYFSRTTDQNGEAVYTAKPELRKLIKFNTLNLLSEWPMKRKFDVVFCRNVVIYFDLKTQTDLWSRYRKILKPNGILFLGHSERIADPSVFGFDCTGPTTYRRRA